MCLVVWDQLGYSLLPELWAIDALCCAGRRKSDEGLGREDDAVECRLSGAEKRCLTVGPGSL